MQNKIGSIKITPVDFSGSCVWFIPAMQDAGSGAAQDRCPLANNAVLGVSTTDAAVWGAPGFASSALAAALDKGVSIPAGALGWNLSAGESLLLAFQCKAAAPAVESWVLGDRSSGQGILMSINTSGQPQLMVRDGISGFTSGYATNATVFDGVLHTVVIYIDGVLKTATAWTDGVAWSTVNSTPVASSPSGSTISSKPFGFGHAGTPTSNGCVAAAWRNLHAYVKAASIANIAALAARLLRDPYKPLSSREL